MWCSTNCVTNTKVNEKGKNCTFFVNNRQFELGSLHVYTVYHTCTAWAPAQLSFVAYLIVAYLSVGFVVGVLKESSSLEMRLGLVVVVDILNWYLHQLSIINEMWCVYEIGMISASRSFHCISISTSKLSMPRKSFKNSMCQKAMFYVGNKHDRHIITWC